MVRGMAEWKKSVVIFRVGEKYIIIGIKRKGIRMVNVLENLNDETRFERQYERGTRQE